MWAAALALVAALCLLNGAAPGAVEEQLARHRNLGKAFYENPTTQKEAVEEFRKALKLAPDSAREQLNLGLALLRAGNTAEGVAEIEKVQKREPKLPQTWFNLGIVFKKQGEVEKATAQFERMIQLAPDEPISHYNLGALYKMAGKTDQSIEQFETASKLDPNLSAPHFQLYNAYRMSGKPADARRELEVFQRLKKQAEGAAVPEDVEWSAYAEIYDIPVDKAPADTPSEIKFDDRKIEGAASGALFIDATGTGQLSVLVWSSTSLRLEPGGVIAELKGITSVAPADFNNDGLTDLCVLTESGPVLFVNKKGKFEKLAGGLAAGKFEKAVWLDYDHDYDLDLFLLGSKPVLLRNQGAAGFQDHTADFPFVQGEAIDGTVIRVLADTKGMDLVVSYRDRDAILYRDKLAGKYEAEPFPTPAGARQLRVADLDNDGWLDLLYRQANAVTMLRNMKGKFEAVGNTPIQSSADAIVTADLSNRGVKDVIAGGTIHKFGNDKATPRNATIPACSSADAADMNGDGRVDLVCVAGNAAHVLTNRTVSKNEWIRVKLVGIKNLKLAPEAEVEVKAGGRYQKKVYKGVPLVFGLGMEKNIDTVRITWPNGLIQNEIKQAAGKQATYQEAQRLSGSCPIIWTWNGKEFEYITDVLGVAPLGASSGDGEYFPVDHDEYIQIPGQSLAAVDGRYEVRITEELSEVAYLDHVRLIAVDHPAGADLYTNEKFKGPPFPEFRLYGVNKRLYPVRATDGGGRNVLAKLIAKDRTYPDTFARTLTGVAETHYLDLDFGRAAIATDGGVLVLSGWVDWADGSTFMGIAQEGRGGLIPPYLQVRDARGEWKTVIEDMGMPAGKPKTIAVDLAGKWITNSREVRIVTNLCVYWDEIFLSPDSGAPRVKQTILPQQLAQLRFRGFSPTKIHPERKQPEAFFYANAMPVSLWNPTPAGRYTRYGDVSELTAAVDDKLVVMGSGDELRLQFDARNVSAVPAGWKRDFLLLVDGWAKDRDANTAFSQSTEPLPFHSMSKFPYPANEHFPDDAEHRAYRERYNTRPALRLIRPLTD